ncbi:uncharacterized protein LOC128831280 [Malaclemys terrapin pileata]|uniref:uncharacterized protein LOC128831280 n=1 Tax=Malaclemys terrapin pileata TaxID=2991368 RepID=UPI0023A8575C|nr:uncharacterized protein LOC128831280 [Malaclemys terrapin pileata]
MPSPQATPITEPSTLRFSQSAALGHLWAPRCCWCPLPFAADQRLMPCPLRQRRLVTSRLYFICGKSLCWGPEGTQQNKCWSLGTPIEDQGPIVVGAVQTQNKKTVLVCKVLSPQTWPLSPHSQGLEPVSSQGTRRGIITFGRAGWSSSGPSSPPLCSFSKAPAFNQPLRPFDLTEIPLCLKSSQVFSLTQLQLSARKGLFPFSCLKETPSHRILLRLRFKHYEPALSHSKK